MWCIDSRATHYITTNKYLFLIYERFNALTSVTVADSKVMNTVGQSKMALEVVNGIEWNTLWLESVWFVLDLVRKLDQVRFCLKFGGGVSTISKNGVACTVTLYSSGMYNIMVSDSQSNSNTTAFALFVDLLL